MKKVLLIVGLAATQTFVAQQIITVETFNLPTPESYWDGSDLSGNFTLNGVGNASITFENSFDTTFGYWLGGFAVSNQTTDSAQGFGGLYSSHAGGGYNSSNNYLIGQNFASIYLNDMMLTSLRITNNNYAASSMQYGDAFAKKFGGPTGTDPDYFKIKAYFYTNDSDVVAIDSSEFYLGDYQSSDSTQDYIIKEWTEWILPQVIVEKISFVLESTDIGMWGMNTPAFFAIDHFSYAVPSTIIENNTMPSIYPNPSNGILNINGDSFEAYEVYDLSGKIMLSGFNTQNNIIDIQELNTGIYTLCIKYNNYTLASKFVRL